MRIGWLLAGLAMLATAPATARWRAAESAHFVVYSEQPAAKLRAFAESLERFDAALRLLSGAPPRAPRAGRVTVFQLDDVAAIRKLTGGPSSIVAGMYLPRAAGSVAFVPAADIGNGWYDTGPKMTSRSILLHEYAHHFMFFNVPGAYPRWYSEGFAEFAGATTFAADGSVTIGGVAMYRTPALLRGAVSVPQILTSDGPIRAIDQDEFYARSWALTHYLTFTQTRKGQLDAYLRAVSAGTPRDKAAAAAFGDLAALDREVRVYTANRTMPGLRLAASLVPIGAVTVRETGDGENAMLPVRVVSWRGVDDRQAAALLPQARAAAAQYPADPFVQTALAEAEFDSKHFAESQAAADRALAADPKNVKAMIYRGRASTAIVAAAKTPATAPAWEEARRWFTAAARAAPDDPEAAVEQYRSYAASGGAVPRAASTALIQAADLAPEDADVQLDAGRASLTMGDVAGARARLSRLRSAAHGGNGTRFAAVWQALDAGDPTAAVKALDAARAPQPPAKPGV